MDAAARARKEAHVAGLGGTHPGEVHAVLAAGVAAHIALRLAIAAAGPTYLRWPRAVRLVLELLLTVAVPCACALWPPGPGVLWAAGAVLATLLAGLAHVGGPKHGNDDAARFALAVLNAPPRDRPWVASLRALLTTLTAFAILAVDFTVFPRRLAKTETYGTSLMDVGVGLVVFLRGLGSGLGGAPPRGLRASLRASVPLATLGALRLAATRATGYQEHVTEYGVHWNFFFTLALLQPGAALARMLLNARDGVLGVVLAVDYQLLLATGLAEYIEHAPRTPGLFAANREGVCSLVGYVAVYLYSRHVGAALRHRDTLAQWRIAGWRTLAPHIVVLGSAVYWMPVSRRLCNLPYAAWTVAVGAACAALLLAVEALVPADATQHTELVDAASRWSFALFLACNVFTGLINLGLGDTTAVSDAHALAILAAYMAVLHLGAVWLDRRYGHKR